MPINSTCDKQTVQKLRLLLPQLYHTLPQILYIYDKFSNVPWQKGLESGLLWCDEGVYRIAKELQLLNPGKFGNIFLGIEAFHLEEVVLACCVKYLEESGIDSIFVEQETFGPEVVTLIMAGGNYIYGKREIALISEALQHLQFSEFIKTVDISGLQALFRTENRTPESIKSACKCCQNKN